MDMSLSHAQSLKWSDVEKVSVAKMLGGIRRVESFLLVLVQFGGFEEFSEGFHV